MMNTSRTAWRDHVLDHLIVARLVDSRRYDDIYREMRAQGLVDEDLDWWHSIARERLAVRLPSKHETVLHGSVGPKGARSWISRGGK